MSRSLKRVLIVLGGAAGLLVLVATAVVLFVDVNRYKPGAEAAASEALGMEVRIGGRLGVGLLPGFHVTVADGRILDERGRVIAVAERTRLWIDPFSLLRRSLRLRRIDLTRPRLSIERGVEDGFNVARLTKAAALLGALDGGRLSISGGTLHYADRRSGMGFEATGCDLVVNRIRFARGTSPQHLKGLSLEGNLACGELRTRKLSVTALKVRFDAKDGVFEFDPAVLRVFGGQASGALRADFSGAVPLIRIRCSLPAFRVEEFLATLSPKKAAEGAMDFSANLSMQGRTRDQWVRTLAGEFSLRGSDITIVGTDIDRALSRFASSQSFNLVDVGAVFLAGPVGLAVTKGYNFASLFRGSGGNSSIGTLVSDWTVERGVARAKDVALATARNRIALHGGLDFVHEHFADVTVAVVDAEGCATVRQTLRGPFAGPAVEKPRILRSLAGPALKLYRQTRGLFPAGPCEIFYSGSVAPPK